MEFGSFLSELWPARLSVIRATGLTFTISSLSIILGTLLGIITGVILTYGHWSAKAVFRIYTDVIRGTPVFVLILMAFFILPAVGINLDPVQAGIVALTVFASSHVGEILRGALLALPRGQAEASLAIGLTFRQSFFYVLFPQALRQMLPTWVNTATEIVKASTLLSVIGVTELLLAVQQIISRNFLSLEFYFFAGTIYFLINYGIERAGRFAERKVAIPT